MLLKANFLVDVLYLEKVSYAHFFDGIKVDILSGVPK